MEKNALSIVVPVLNEAGNIESLFERINVVCIRNGIDYEIIIIDDHSTDNTEGVLNSLQNLYPVKYFKKSGKRGKAYSLLEGFEKAQYPVLAFMDGDLQYPPEALAPMLEKIQSGADIVLTERSVRETSLVRKITSKTFAYFFGKLLHGLPYDIQSGMKMFRKTTIRRFSVKPSQWTYDLEFILKARFAGFKIDSVKIPFAERKSGSTKVRLLSSSWEIGWNALKMKWQKINLIRFLPEDELKEGQGFHYKGKKLIPHTWMNWRNSAFVRISTLQLCSVFFILILLIFGLKEYWHATIVALIAGLTLFYFSDLLFSLFLVIKTFTSDPEISFSKEEIDSLRDEQLPVYTILCPMYKEWSILPQFIDSINKLDYPKNKLQAVLLLEEDDKETVEKVRQMQLPSFFYVGVVPDSHPKTKPKALNYALGKITGEYVVVYDAEDIPDPLQLKKSYLAFQKCDPDIVCIQAKLNFYNPYQNLLTRLFAVEYSLWFDLILPGLQSIQAPLPLGGTSNHFRLRDLKKLKGWDPFNVTEDADLGMRIFDKGYKTAVLDSTTMEEANSKLGNWLRQRSRWIKGYMQTFLVHTRNPKKFLLNFSNPRAFSFNLIIGGKILSMIINPLMWTLTITYFVFKDNLGSFIESFFPTPIFYIAVVSLFLGNFLYTYYYMMGALKRKQWQLIIVSLFSPIYWLMISIAALIAFWELIWRPHYWQKTQHGLYNKPVVPNLITT